MSSFKGPDPQALASRLAGLSPEKQSLLARKLAERAAAGGVALDVDRISKRANPGPARLSRAQETLWLYEQMNPGTAAYNVPVVRRVRGVLDVAALERALNAVAHRHEALRTTFVELEEGVRQVVATEQATRLDVHDVRGAADPQAEAERMLREAAATPFDLARGPLWRPLLVAVAEDEALLLIVVHHVVFDGASIAVLLRDLSVAYAAVLAGRAPEFAPLPIQLADYAEWERSTLTAERVAPALAFWRDYLAGAPSTIDLPTDRPRTRARSGPGGRAATTFDPQLRDAVRRVAQTHGVTPFMVLLATFQTLLHRYSAQDDLVVGVPVAGRSHTETEPLIGYLARTVILRARFDDDPTFLDLLRAMRNSTAGAFEHQQLPAEQLVKELRAGRGGESGALFDVLFVLQDGTQPHSSLGPARLSSMGTEIGSAKFDLTLMMAETDAGLRAVVEYRSDLFDAETVDGMLRHLGALLAAACDSPGERVSRIPLLPAAERRALLESWQGPSLPFDETATIGALFVAQSARTPDAPALVHDGAVLTYRELHERSTRVAMHLRALGVVPGVRVAICAARSVDLVAGLLGILKAGGVYVPLDPAYPEERLQVIIEDAGAAVLVTESAQLAALPVLGVLTRAAGGPRVLLLDEMADGPATHETELATAGPRDLAYVIYTSGSTGRPKGVAIEHRSAVAFITWARTVFNDAEVAGVVASTSICFDLSVFELFVPLSLGGTVLLIENALSLPELRSPIQPTLVNTVPSAIAALLRLGAVPETVRTVNLAGEPLPQDTVNDLYALPHVRHVYDLYGPSEDTTYSTFVLRTAGGRASIGRAIANTQAYVLDRNMQPVPAGVPGELYLGGAGLARGYLGRPDLTAERFLLNPFAIEMALLHDDRLYRTGDRVRWTRAGFFEYMGRLDFMVKLRGFRIELGEIESVLRAQPGIASAVVIVREEANDEKRLVAYVAPRPGEECPPHTHLVAALRARLPEYMVPAALVELPAMPLTPNGKIDRKALPAPPDVMEADDAFVAPRDDVETVVAGVWRDVLRRERIGVESSFFDLGGHSLLATRIAGQIGKIFRTTLPLRRFFETPTVGGIARALVVAEPKSGQTAAIARLYRKAKSMTAEQRERLTQEKVRADKRTTGEQ